MIEDIPLVATDKSASILKRGIDVIEIEAAALSALAETLDDSFVEACETIMSAHGRIVVTGMGKSGHIGRKFAATLAATGTPATYVHPAEAAHGDLGMLVAEDVLIVLSNSGNTSELGAILRHAHDIGVKVIGIASKLGSLVMINADIRICLPSFREACHANIAPTSSTTIQLALGDAIAMAVMDMRGFSRDGMKKLHPGGSIGLRLTPVSAIMHERDRLPLVTANTPMKEVVLTMTSHGFGVAGVVDDSGQLVGIITDGDLRRHFEVLMTTVASQVMAKSPKIFPSDMLAEDALYFLNEAKITAAFVVGADQPMGTEIPIGIVHIHDFLRIGLN